MSAIAIAKSVINQYRAASDSWLALCDRLGLAPSATVEDVLRAADCCPRERDAARLDSEAGALNYPEYPERFYR